MIYLRYLGREVYKKNQHTIYSQALSTISTSYHELLRLCFVKHLPFFHHQSMRRNTQNGGN